MPPTLPSPGVSQIGGSGDRTDLPQDAVRTGRRSTRDVDPVSARAAAGKLKVVKSGRSDTAGTIRADRKVLEIQHNTRGSDLGVAEIVSADGQTYKHRYKDAKTGKMLGDAWFQMFLIMFRELALDPTGGSLRAVFSAYKIKFPDSDGNPLLPLTIDMIRNARAGSGAVIAGDPEPGLDLHDDGGGLLGAGDGFAVAEDDGI